MSQQAERERVLIFCNSDEEGGAPFVVMETHRFTACLLDGHGLGDFWIGRDEAIEHDEYRMLVAAWDAGNDQAFNAFLDLADLDAELTALEEGGLAL